MRRKIVKFSLGLLVLLTVLVIGFVLGDIYEQNSTETAANISKVSQSLPTRAELLKLVNAERAKVGVKPLVESPLLDWSAQQKADDMRKYNYEGHESPKSPHDQGNARYWLLQSGILCSDTSENLHEGTKYYATDAGAVAGWMGSPPHRKAMLNANYTLTGFGFAKLPNGDEVFVQHFCQP